MRYRLTWHARQRMRERVVSEDHIQEVLASIGLQYPAEPGSICIVGTVSDGRQLAIFVVGDAPPVEEPIKIKSVVWRQ